MLHTLGGPGSSVGIATGYGLDGPGIESRCGEIFRTRPYYPTFCTMGTESFHGVKDGRGVTLTPHSLLVPWSRKNRAIPLLPLWAVRPAQSLSACTRVHFTLFCHNFFLVVVEKGRDLDNQEIDVEFPARAKIFFPKASKSSQQKQYSISARRPCWLQTLITSAKAGWSSPRLKPGALRK